MPATTSTTTFPISLTTLRAVPVPGRRDARLGIAPLAKVLPDAPAVLGAELTLERIEKLGAPNLVAAARTEHGPDQAADGDDVRSRPARQRETCFAVLRVDPGDVRVDDPDRASPRLPARTEEVELAQEGRFRPGTRPERPPGERERERIDARSVERGDPARAAEELHQQLAIRGRRPARPEGDVLGRHALDMRHTPAVAGDGEPLARPLDAAGALPGGQPERLSLEEATEVGIGDVAPEPVSGPRTARSGRSSSS